MRTLSCVIALALAGLATSLPAQDGQHLKARTRGTKFTDPAATIKEPRTQSITYVVNGQEVTRYFEAMPTQHGSVVVNEITGPGGNKITTVGETLRADSGRKLSTQTTHPGGKTSSSEFEWIMEGMGYKRIGTHTSRNGGTSTSEKSVTKTEEGHEFRNVVIGPDGQTYVATGALTRGNGTATRNSTITGPNGETISHVDTWTKTEGGWTRESSTTGPKGNGTERTREVTRDGRTVTVNQTRDRASGTQAGEKTAPTKPESPRGNAQAQAPGANAAQRPAQEAHRGNADKPSGASKPAAGGGRPK